MKTTQLIALLLAYLAVLGSPSMALSQAEIEVRKAQAAPEAPMIERVLRATPAPKAEAVRPAAQLPEHVSSHSGNNYRLRANDQLDIRVFGHADLSGLSTVRQDGTLRLPLIQEVVNVGGQTLESVEVRIRNLLAADYLRNPQVAVNISRHSTMKITVLGRVNQPKTYGVPSNQPITLVQAIGLAGGRSNLGNLRKVSLKRGNSVQIFDVLEMMDETNAASIQLQDGDVINVPDKLF